MKFIIVFIFSAVQLGLINSANAGHEILKADRDQMIRDFVLGAISADESYSDLADSVKRITLKSRSKNSGKRAACGAAWMGKCPKNIQENFETLTLTYLAHGENFVCTVKGIWSWAPLQGQILVGEDVSCEAN